MASAAERLVVLVLILLAARALSVAEYADFQQMALLAALIAGPASSGLTAVLARVVARNGNAQALAERILVYALIAHSIFYLVAISLALRGDDVPRGVRDVLWLLLFLEVVIVFNLFRGALIFAEESRLKAFAVVSLISCLGVMSFAISTSCVLDAGAQDIACMHRMVSELMAYYVFALGVAPFVAAFRLLRRRSNARFESVDWRTFIYAAAVSLLGFACDSLEFIVGWGVLPDLDFATMRSAAIRVPLIEVITISAATVAIHRLGGALRANQIGHAAQAVRSAAIQSITWVLPVTAFCMVFSGPIVLVLFGSKYSAAGPLLTIYYLKYSITHIVLGMMLPAVGEAKYVIRGQILYLVLVIPLIGMACVWAGPTIVVPVSVAAYLLMHLALLRRLATTIGVPIVALFPIRHFVWTFGLSLVVAGVLISVVTVIEIAPTIWLLGIAWPLHYLVVRLLIRHGKRHEKGL